MNQIFECIVTALLVSCPKVILNKREIIISYCQITTQGRLHPTKTIIITLKLIV